MSRPVTISKPPRRSLCPKCKAPVTRLYTGNRRSIDLERGTSTVHRCQRKDPS